ncbi:hypothetical protein K6U37_04760, partial [Vibrio parahaemolyticus]|nr:hypothetical protein [Vibrio parahaemolyticus]
MYVALFISVTLSTENNVEVAMKKISKLLVGFSFALPVLFLLLSKTGTADTMDKMKALENAEIA